MYIPIISLLKNDMLTKPINDVCFITLNIVGLCFISFIFYNIIHIAKITRLELLIC